MSENGLGAEEDSLREKSLTAASRLAVREVAGIAIRLLGVVAVTRLIGPRDYGIYAGSFAFVALLTNVAQQGVEVYLISLQDEPDSDRYAVALTYLTLTTLASVAVGLVGSFLVSAFIGYGRYILPFQVLLISVPLNALWAPAQARLERSFGYRWLAYLELGSDLILYAVAVPLALAGAGVWAPVYGWIACQGLLLVGSYIGARLAPRLLWRRDDLRQISRYATSYSAATWVLNVQALINPVIVGSYFGAAAVGVVALTERLVDTLGFVTRATWRLAVVALSRVQEDAARLRRGIEDGMAMQILSLGVVLAGFAVVSSVAVEFLFGHRWAEAIRLFPWVASVNLLATVMLIPVAVLRTKSQNWPVLMDQLGGALLFAGAALVLVPRLGITGYGVAGLFRLLSRVVTHRAAQGVVRFSYARVLPWLFALVPPLFFSLAPLPWAALLFVPGLLVLLHPDSRRQSLTLLAVIGNRVRR